MDECKPLFAGTTNSRFNLGADSDIASGELRFNETRSFANLVGDFHVPPTFQAGLSAMS